MDKWFLENTNNLVGAGNLTTSIFLFVVAGGLIYYQFVRKTFNNASPELNLLIFGVTLEAIGWGLHRFYYSIPRILNSIIKNNDNTKENIALLQSIHTFILDHVYLALIPLSLCLVGLGFIVSVMFAHFIDSSGKHALRAAISVWGLMIGIFWFFFWTL